ncbi:MAG: 50S ribosomal protein L10 [Cyclobacteriaceae bacterium]|nr:50S ribosomal protein L10 [Cyclobacteriaceae bacterium]MCK5207545.1 50S ribosomal protein L10 [Cyclobacteriaceae bacterium]MCK5278622.1 50S ribosomal protein L10 [Cyclobacteriaceae bacterium]MCK5367202.1 50S ribosomal protein L10 [Cyclobacteriaceae bacterium]MCK5467878.1 50S ribosomal protein L10 [Cyclobacteriaceae bacterium]
MTKQEKTQVISELAQRFSETINFYFADASGLTVAEINKFRRICFEKGVEYNVYKNTLIKKALETLDTNYSSFDDTVLKGFTGIIFSKGSGNLPAKVIKEFRKAGGGDKPLFKGASIDTDLFIGNDQLDALSKLKSKFELIGDVIMLLQSPAKNVISSLQSGQNKLAGILKTLSEREQA